MHVRVLARRIKADGYDYALASRGWRLCIRKGRKREEEGEEDNNSGSSSKH
ncbi:hypothetical protein HRbin04_01067 [archaeon HR04]|nr:hypothetical protein HRbin04_01067 [archaeon HR04]